MISKIAVDSIPWLKGKVEVNSLVFDEKGNRVDSVRSEIDLSRYPRKEIYEYSDLSVSTGTYKCRVVIRHLETGKSAVGLSRVSIPGKPDMGIVLDSPLLLLPKGGALYVYAAKSEQKKREREYSPLLAYYPFDASRYTPLIGELPQGSSSLFAVVRCSFFRIKDPKITCYGKLIHEETGVEIPVSVSPLKRYKEKDSIMSFLELRLSELRPGSYRLEFIAEEEETKLTSQATTILVIK
jgi:hypothetical protein